MKCENCEGTGKIIINYLETRGVYKTEIIKCFVCDGKGNEIEETKETKKEDKNVN